MVTFYCMLTFIVILERVDVKSNPGYSKVCTQAAKYKFVKKNAFLISLPKMDFLLTALFLTLAILVQELLTCLIDHGVIVAVEGFQSRSFIDTICGKPERVSR